MEVEDLMKKAFSNQKLINRLLMWPSKNIFYKPNCKFKSQKRFYFNVYIVRYILAVKYIVGN